MDEAELGRVRILSPLSPAPAAAGFAGCPHVFVAIDFTAARRDKSNDGAIGLSDRMDTVAVGLAGRAADK